MRSTEAHPRGHVRPPPDQPSQLDHRERRRRIPPLIPLAAAPANLIGCTLGACGTRREGVGSGQGKAVIDLAVPMV